MTTAPSVLLIAAVVLLVGSNLALDVGTLWLLEEVGRASDPFHQIALGLILGQLMLTALWLGLGDGRWYLRLVPAVALSLSLGLTIGVAGRLSTHARDYDPDFSSIFAFILLAMMLAASCVVFMVRRTRGWRLTLGPMASANDTHQFQIGDTLLWMVFIGGSLGAVRFLMTIDESFLEQLQPLGLYTALLTVVGFASLVAAFAIRWRDLAALAVVVVLTAALVAMPDAYDNVQRMRATATVPVPPYRYFEACWNQIKSYEVCGISLAACVFVNCRVLRRLGFQLRRRGAVLSGGLRLPLL